MITIYTLTCPIVNKVVYIGATSKTLESRLIGHVSSNDGSKRANWLTELRNNGLKPIIEAIDTTDSDGSLKVEEYWINQFRAWGFKLYNSNNVVTYGNSIVRRKGNNKHKREIER